MSTFVKAPIRTHVRFVGALLMACTFGCGDRVNLGSGPPSPPTDTDGGTGDDGSLVTLLRFDANLYGCNGIVADNTYLYFSTFEQDGPSVHRCRKTDCGATLTRVARAPCAHCAYEVMERVGDRLGFASTHWLDPNGFDHVAACTPPDCSDLQTVVGEFPELNSVAFGDGQIYFSISSDRTIYACGFPSCTEGPRAFVRGSFSGHLTTHREWVYWLDGAVRRKLRDGSSAAEALDLGAVLGPAVDGGTAPGAMGVLPRSIAAQDGWLYALVQSSSDPDIACDRPGDACVIARWRDDALGNPRELVYKSATPIDYNRRPILVLDGELIFSAGPNGLTYSCDAANCPATLRPLGEGSTNAVTSDGNHLYWCTSGADGQGEIRRIARLRR